MADSSSPKITGESVLSGCGKLSGGSCTGRPILDLHDLEQFWRGKPGRWLRMFEWLALFFASAFPGEIALFNVLNSSFGKGPPATSF